MTNPQVICLISGKRKCGKDYMCAKIQSKLGKETCTVIRISGPLKCLYAKNHNLDFQELLSDGPYKEKYRMDMIQWSEKIRDSDPGYFCRAACNDAKLTPVWLISDIRRKTDIKWFIDNYADKIKIVRIQATINIRCDRGWIFTEGVDDVESECNLDDFDQWDLRCNNNNDEELEKGLEEIISLIQYT